MSTPREPPEPINLGYPGIGRWTARSLPDLRRPQPHLDLEGGEDDVDMGPIEDWQAETDPDGQLRGRMLDRVPLWAIWPLVALLAAAAAIFVVG